MTIGVISDTHGLLRLEAVESLQGSDLILHAGDVGNIEVASDGRGTLQIVADNWTLDDAAKQQNPVGTAVVIHSGPDDFETQPDGAAGTRIGCGVIEVVSSTDASARNP